MKERCLRQKNSWDVLLTVISLKARSPFREFSDWCFVCKFFGPHCTNPICAGFWSSRVIPPIADRANAPCPPSSDPASPARCSLAPAASPPCPRSWYVKEPRATSTRGAVPPTSNASTRFFSFGRPLATASALYPRLTASGAIADAPSFRACSFLLPRSAPPWCARPALRP